MYFRNLSSSYTMFKQEYLDAIDKVLTSGNLLYGPQLEQFEHDFAAYTGAQRCIGVANATDALTLILRALKPAQVAIPNFTALPTAVAVQRATHGNVLHHCVDVDKSLTMNPYSIPKMLPGSVVVYVGLFGNIGGIEKIVEICRENLYWLVIDAAQSTGSGLEKYGHFAASSFYPTKPLGNYQDGGAVLINLQNSRNMNLYEKRIRELAFYGADRKNPTMPISPGGINSRLSEISAAILNVRSRHFADELNEVRNYARSYLQVVNAGSVKWHEDAAFHQFVMLVNDRRLVMEMADKEEVPLMIHYPYHIQDIYPSFSLPKIIVNRRVSDKIISLPLYPYMNFSDLVRVFGFLETIKHLEFTND